MNDIPSSEFEYEAQREMSPRVDTGTGLLVALGIGLLAGALFHLLRPAPKPQQRLARMIEDMEESLRDASGPAFNKVSKLASKGAHRLGNQLHRSEAQVEKFLHDAARRLRRLAS